MGGEFEFGNDKLTIMMSEDGHLAGIRNRDGVHRNRDFRKLGALFNVTLLENVYGLDAGKRRTVALKPVSREGDSITIAPDTGELPRFTFRTTDKDSYFVLELVSMKNPRKEHAAVITMQNVQWTEWMPLDGVTKKTYRLGNRPSFFGVLRRNRKNPLGSIAMWHPKCNEEFNETLYSIWVNENMPRPKVEGEWTVARAKRWVTDYHRTCDSISMQMIIGPRSPDDLKPLADKAKDLGMNQVYMHLNSWGGRYWPSDQDNFEVNRKIFPGGTKDMVAFSRYLTSRGLRLTYRTVSYALGGQHPEYLGKVPDARLASWWRGKLARSTDAQAKQIVVAEGTEHTTEYDAGRRFGEVYRRDCMQIGNELVTFSGYSKNGDGTWTLKDCRRGFGNTAAVSHAAGERARGLYRAYGIAFAPDPDTTLMEQMAKRFAEFHNDTNAGIANFDALEVHAMMFPYGTTKFMGEVYRHLDHPVHGSTSGGDMTWGFIENRFRPVEKPEKPASPVPEWQKKVRHHIPYANDMKIGLHQSHRNASGPYAYVWAVPANAARGRLPAITAQSGFHDITLDILDNHGLVKHYGKALSQWRQYGPRLPEPVKWRIFTAGKQNGWSSRYCMIDEIFRFDGEGDALSVVPFRVMKREGGIDRGWTYHQEFGTIYPYQYVRPAQSIRVKNPYHAQVPEFIVRVMPDFSRDVDSMRMKVAGESEEARKFNDMLDKFQGASGVDIKDRPAKPIMPCDQQSAAITLKGGRKYYIEALHKDGGGGDNLAVAWAGPGVKMGHHRREVPVPGRFRQEGLHPARMVDGHRWRHARRPDLPRQVPRPAHRQQQAHFLRGPGRLGGQLRHAYARLHPSAVERRVHVLDFER